MREEEEEEEEEGGEEEEGEGGRTDAGRTGPGGRRARRKEKEKKEREEEGEEGRRETVYKTALSRDMMPAPVFCPPPPARETTFAEDLAVIKAAEKQLRHACDEGSVSRAVRLLQGGAVFDEWDSCTSTCAETLAAAQQKVWREEEGEFVGSGSTESGAEDSEVEQWLLELGVDPEKAFNPPHQDVFLDCQVTQRLRTLISGDVRAERRHVQRLVKEVQVANPKMKYIQPQHDELHFATFRSGDEDAVHSDEEDDDWAEISGFEDWEDPLGRRMDKVELAVKRNATEELEEDEKEKIEWLTCPCQELQELMSSSVSEDGAESAPLIKIKKSATEITQGELDPWDKTNDGRLSESFGGKSFDVVDTLRGFQRVSDMQGVRGSDQNYNQVRSRFLAAKTGSYKRPGNRPLTSRKDSNK